MMMEHSMPMFTRWHVGVRAVVAVVIGLFVWLAAAARASAEEPVVRTFNPISAEQTFVVPAGVTEINVQAIGGKGGRTRGGSAAEVNAEVAVTPGETLYIEVGGSASGASGGFNGGGGGGSTFGGGGGGASDIRRAPRSAGLSPGTRFIVAAGGGGEGTGRAFGGDAGEAGEEEEFLGGGAGTATAGGKAERASECLTPKGLRGPSAQAEDGTRGAGGAGGFCASKDFSEGAGGGGGGGGYFGGGGGAAEFEAGFEDEAGGGGGGSSLVPAGGVLKVVSSPPVVQLAYEQPGNAPAVVTGAVTSLTAQSATLNATVNPEETSVTDCEFEYGPTTMYGQSVPCSGSPGSGFTPVPVSAGVEGLGSGSTYHYRIVARNGVGTSFGADREFTTAAHEAATVSGFSPTAGPVAGGATVTFTGTELQHITAVRFGSASATALTVISANELTAASPAGSGNVKVTLVSDLGQETVAGSYLYVPRPSIKKLSAKKGPAAGGTTVVITGANLEGVSEVLFGSTPGTAVSAGPASVTVVSPPSTAGKPDVTVVSAGGQSEASSKLTFEFERPTVTSLAPSSGPLAGGTAVTVTGTGFALGSGTVFKFGSLLATSVDCTSVTQCTVVAPAGRKSGVVDVLASVGKSKSKKSPPGDVFTYG
jgi:IPT/TIG domain-containing protein